MTLNAKTRSYMQRLRKAMKNLKQHFYKIKQVKKLAVIRQNE